MVSDTDSHEVLTRKEREDLILDLYFSQNKTYHEIAKIARISPRDIKPIVDKAISEKERTEHKSTAVQAYELFRKGKTLLEVTIDLNLGHSQATVYFGEYLRLVGLDDITKIYQELQDAAWYFVKLCKEAKAAKMGISQVVNLLRIANNYLPSVEHRYGMLEKQTNNLESILSTQAREFQNLSSQITYMNSRLADIKSECSNENIRLEHLRHQAANLETVVNHFKNYDNGEYSKVIKAVQGEVQRNLSDIKPLLDLAIFSVVQSMRTNPDKYYPLVYSNNPRLLSSSKDNGHSNYKYISSSSEKQEERQSQYDYFSIEDCQTELLGQAKEFYALLVDRLLCEVINGIVINKQHAPLLSASLPLEFHNTQENDDSDDNKQ
jgi:hypothetical protein